MIKDKLRSKDFIDSEYFESGCLRLSRCLDVIFNGEDYLMSLTVLYDRIEDIYNSVLKNKDDLPDGYEKALKLIVPACNETLNEIYQEVRELIDQLAKEK